MGQKTNKPFFRRINLSEQLTQIYFYFQVVFGFCFSSASSASKFCQQTHFTTVSYISSVSRWVVYF